MLRTLLVVLALVGCTSLPELPPDLGPEHARLAMLTGHWEASNRAEFADGRAPLDIDADVRADWELGGRFVVARSRFVYGDPSLAPTESVGWFTWDGAAGTYRYWTFQGQGGVVEGVMEFDPSTETWTMIERRLDPATGRLTVSGQGTMVYLSPQEKRLTWQALSAQGPVYAVEGRSVLLDAGS